MRRRESTADEVSEQSGSVVGQEAFGVVLDPPSGRSCGGPHDLSSVQATTSSESGTVSGWMSRLWYRVAWNGFGSPT